MHELSIAIALIDQIKEIAEENHLNKIDEVELQTGFLRQVIPELMLEAFKEASRETIAQGAVLKIAEINALVRCRQCQTTFEPTINDFLCPLCQEADVDILQGNDIILASISCKQ